MDFFSSAELRRCQTDALGPERTRLKRGSGMKKLIAIASAAALGLGLAACDSHAENAKEDAAAATEQAAQAQADTIREATDGTTAEAAGEAVDGGGVRSADGGLVVPEALREPDARFEGRRDAKAGRQVGRRRAELSLQEPIRTGLGVRSGAGFLRPTRARRSIRGRPASGTPAYLDEARNRRR